MCRYKKGVTTSFDIICSYLDIASFLVPRSSFLISLHSASHFSNHSLSTHRSHRALHLHIHNTSCEYSIYYTTTLPAQTHPNLGISQTGMKVMNDFVLDMFDKLATEAKNDLQLNQAGGGGRSTTMLPKHFNTATKLILPGELAKHGLSEGSRAVLMHKTWSANSGGKK